MQPASVLHPKNDTPISFTPAEHENLKLKEENRKLKEENERLKENFKNLLFHSDQISKLLKNVNLEPDNKVGSDQEYSMISIAKKNAFEEYENRPARNRLTVNHEWDWENRPIKPTSILINQSSADYQRRRSKSVCFGERNLIHELIEIENNRSTDNYEPKVEIEKPEKQANKRLDSSEEEVCRREKTSKKVKSSKLNAKPSTNKAVSKTPVQPPIYNLDTSSESNQNDFKVEIRNEKPG